MRELGADWDAEEEAEAAEALDPFEKGAVPFRSFVQWWKN